MRHLNNLKYMAMALFVAMLSLSFTACSDDDDDPKVGNSNIVGTWVMDDYYNAGKDCRVILVFGSNGSGSLTFDYDDGTDDDTSYFQYVYREKEGGISTVEFIWTGTSKPLYYDDDEYSVSVTSSRLRIGSYDPDEYVRQ